MIHRAPWNSGVLLVLVSSSAGASPYAYATDPTGTPSAAPVSPATPVPSAASTGSVPPAGAVSPVTAAPPPAVQPAPASPVAACRAPQSTRAKPGERWAVDSPSGQAGDWAAWMTEQLAAGRSNFLVVPFKGTGKDSDGSDGPADAPLEVLCAW